MTITGRIPDDAHPARDLGGRQAMIAGNDDHPDPGLRGNCATASATSARGGSNNATRPRKHRPASASSRVRAPARPRAAGAPRRAREAPRGRGPRSPSAPRPPPRPERSLLAVPPEDAIRARQHLLRCALAVDQELSVLRVDGRHHLERGVEVELATATSRALLHQLRLRAARPLPGAPPRWRRRSVSICAG